MALLARLISSAASAFGLSTQDDPVGEVADERLAATALLVHVAQADGVLAEAESEKLMRLVQGRYADSAEDARALIARAARFDAETRDLSALVAMVGSEGEAGERKRLLSMAWSVAGADGEVHEFEEALVWRLGKLLSLDDAAIAEARSSAQSEPADGAAP